MSLYENINRRKKLGISRPKRGFNKGGKVGTKKR